MRRATLQDKFQVREILSQTFRDNPGVNSILKKNGDKQVMLNRFFDYIFLMALNRDGVFISDNQKGAAICFLYNKRSATLKEFWLKIRFAFTSIPINRLIRMLKREFYRNKQRPADGNYYYFWFLGVTKNGENAGIELKNGIIAMAKENRLPIYLETTVLRNRKVYERLGFTLYHTFHDEQSEVTFWFMKKE